MFRDIARGYALGRVAASTRATYERAWRMWVEWREWRKKSCWLDARMSEAELVEELVEFMAYCCAVRGNKETTVAGKMVAVNFSHEQWVGLSLPLNHFRIKAVREGIKRAHVDGGTQQRGR